MFLLKTLRAFRFLFIGPLILAMLVVVNLVTSPHHWWVQWAALGIGIAWILSLFRVIRALAVVGGLAALIAYLRNRQTPGKRVEPRPDAPASPERGA